MRSTAMIRPQRLKRIFGINSESFWAYGEGVRIIARIKKHGIIEKIHTQWPAHQKHLPANTSPGSIHAPTCQPDDVRGSEDKSGAAADNGEERLAAAAKVEGELYCYMRRGSEKPPRHRRHRLPVEGLDHRGPFVEIPDRKL